MELCGLTAAGWLHALSSAADRDGTENDHAGELGASDIKVQRMIE
jgi:hypothetical protein